jgi:hypothetical protein
MTAYGVRLQRRDAHALLAGEVLQNVHELVD